MLANNHNGVIYRYGLSSGSELCTILMRMLGRPGQEYQKLCIDQFSVLLTSEVDSLLLALGIFITSSSGQGKVFVTKILRSSNSSLSYLWKMDSSLLLYRSIWLIASFIEYGSIITQDSFNVPQKMLIRWSVHYVTNVWIPVLVPPLIRW